jgi:hypothetical protein
VRLAIARHLPPPGIYPRLPGWQRFPLLLAASLVLAAVAGSTRARADAGFFHLTDPGSLNLALFVNGFGSDKYGTTHEGFELEQSVTTQLGLVARASAYQVYQGTGFDSPLLPASRSSTRNFGRFQGGVDITPLPGVSLTLLGGEDIGDSHAPVVEGDFSSWILPHSLHPINFSFSGSHYYENEVTSGRIDLRAILLSTAEVMLLGGVGGAIWGGGSVGNAKGQGGPDVGIFVRRWHASIDLQAGYGSSHTYGLVNFSRQFHWDE